MKDAASNQRGLSRAQADEEELAIPEVRVPPQVRLESLAPRYDRDRHAVYVEALQRALDGPDEIRNIALTGPYGTGKSSILSELVARYPDRAIELSLSSVGEEPAAADGPDQTVTNRIQKEIVKQILYRDAPHRTSASRFRRLSRFRWQREMPLSAGIALMLLAVLYLTTWSRPFVAAVGKDPGQLVGAYIVLWLLLIAAVLLVRRSTDGRLSLEKLTAGPATVALTGQPSSYFDQYIDEIVYYFEQTRRNIVIFEDLDRFRDVHIFQSLRALNTLLNNAEQIRPEQKRRGRTRGRDLPGQAVPARRGGDGRGADVVFIYALRDSVFERLGDDPRPRDDGATEHESQLANRTKFFDLIVPVVPFITHRNARDLMKMQMVGSGVSLDLISVAAQHVADQRLIIDLRNEFDVYADRLLFGEQVTPGLTADRLFAMLLYKSVNLADFEQIRFRRSQLDRLWDAWRDLVKANIDRATAEEQAAAVALSSEGTPARHAQDLAARVDRLAMDVLGAPSPDTYQVETSGRPRRPSADLRDPAFWRELVDSSSSLSIIYSFKAETWQFSHLEARLDRSLSPHLWAPVELDRQREIRATAAGDLQFLGHHGWRELLQQPKFDLSGEDGVRRTFAGLVQQQLPGSPLARDLITAGYINEYYALYVSIFYGGVVSLAATTFMLQVLDRGRNDPDYQLAAEDVDAILAERGSGVLLERSMRNISVLDRVLGGDLGREDAIVSQLLPWGPDEQAFIERYLRRGRQKQALVRRLAGRVPALPVFLVKKLTGRDRQDLVDLALSQGGWPHQTDGMRELEQYALEEYSQFPSLLRTSKSPEGSAARALAEANLDLPDVTGLSAEALSVLALRGGYALTEANLQALTGQDEIAIDRLRAARPSVAMRVLSRPKEYVSTIRATGGRQVTVADAGDFAATLHWLAEEKVDQQTLDALVRLAGPRVHLPRLVDAPQLSWETLLLSGRTPVDAENLLAWLQIFEGFDALIPLLSTISNVRRGTQVGDSDRQALALALLAAPLPASTRVSLASSLKLSDPLPVEQITPEPGPLAGLLIRTRLVPDNVDSFEHLAVDWSSRHAAIEVSEQFPRYVSPQVLPAIDLEAFFDSAAVSRQAKRAVLRQIGEWVGEWAGDAEPAGLTAAVRWAWSDKLRLSAEELETLLVGDVPTWAMLPLIAAARLPLSELESVLRNLGAPYSELAGHGSGTLMLQDTAAHRSILDRLRTGNTVKGYRNARGALEVTFEEE